ncbi:MAG: sulfite exporter TauE/SafE family protein [Eubacterium sp.]|nr:sulfite exporter TauE/SafE family protein [Eubacterium sp.]
MTDIIYFVVIFVATAIGSLAGIGGGVLIKPIFDAFGEYTASEVSVLSSSAVFAMSFISVLISIPSVRAQKEQLKFMLPLAVGASFGGWFGDFVFSKTATNDSLIKIVQNSLLMLLIIFVIIYMRNENSKSFRKREWHTAAITGIALGATSAFLGIGGGPINVAVITLVFGLEIKTAVLGSLITILFAQGTKLIHLAVKGIAAFEIKLLPYVIAAGILGALTGRMLNKTASNKVVRQIFITVQVMIIILCLFNIIKYGAYI